jgi:type I restriction-modification system DNA methylase subunit
VADQPSAANIDERRQLGSWYTPAALIDQMLSLLTSDGWPNTATTSTLRILDPSCGDGRLLIAAQERIGSPSALTGCDIDPLTRSPNERLGIEFVEGDGLSINWSHFGDDRGFDLVMSNPPFLSQLASSTSRKGASARGGGPYANSAMEFCLAGVEALRPGGRLAIVLPQSVLA